MKFKKHGKVFENIDDARLYFCGHFLNCECCDFKGANCIEICKRWQKGCARFMGFEVIEKIEEEGDKMELPLDIGSMTLAQAKEYCFKHIKSELKCTPEECELLKKKICCGYFVRYWNIDRQLLTPEELEICRALGAKWISCDNEISGVTLWVDKPSFNYMMNKFMSTSGSIAEISKNKFPSINPHDCISVE